MALQPSAEESKDTPAVAELKKMRPLLAWGLLGINGLWLLVALQALLFGGSEGTFRSEFANRAFLAFGEHPDMFGGFAGLLSIGLVGIPQIALPLLALALVSHLKPVVDTLAKPVLITVLAEYAVSALFGLVAFIASFTIDLGSASRGTGRLLTESALYRLGLFALLGLAIYVAVKAALPYFNSPKAGQPFGSYGHQQGWPGASGQQFFGGSADQPGQPSFQGQPGVPGQQPSQPSYGHQPGQPSYGGHPGQHAAQPGYGGGPGVPPVSGQPAQPGQPSYGGRPGQHAPQPGYGGGPGGTGSSAVPPVSGQPGSWAAPPQNP